MTTTGSNHGQRRKRLFIGADFFAVILGEGLRAYRVARDWLPPDAKVVDARMGYGGSCVELLVESESFPEVPPGSVYPEILPTLTVM